MKTEAYPEFKLGSKITLRFDEIQITGKTVVFSHAGTFVYRFDLDHLPQPGETITLRGIRGEMDGELM